jgi:hypothetical protein
MGLLRDFEGPKLRSKRGGKRAMARAARTKEWVVYMLGGKRAQRLGTVVAPDRDAAIATAIERYNITDHERQKRVAVSPME